MDVNPYQTPAETPTDNVAIDHADHSENERKRLPAVAWASIALPPMLMLASIGLGLYIDSLTLGPTGFFFVIILIGVGAWAIWFVSASIIIELLAQGSMLARIFLWIVEIGLIVFAYSQIASLLDGWS